MIGWLDPSIGTANAGDRIIAEAVGREIRRLGPEGVVRLPTQRGWTSAELRDGRGCELFFVGGTNLLTSHPLSYRQWRVGPRELAVLRGKVLLLGVGWWQYQRPPDAISRRLLRLLLHPSRLHSVRDPFTLAQLGRSRARAVNTSCPTLWEAPRSGENTAGFRNTVIATVTDYHPDRERDRHMLRRLEERADQLVVWPQGRGDMAYLDSLGFRGKRLDPVVEAFDDALDEGDVEYVGTRLHAGIRALQRGVPAAIVAIDNRAAEIGSDVGLWTLPRADIEELDEWLAGLSSWSLDLPDDEIRAWREDASSAIAALGGGRSRA